MKIMGLTGGIGSGKSTIAKWFLEMGIPVYDSDQEAKKLMNENSFVKEKLIEIFGPETYKDGLLNRPFLAAQVFDNSIKLNQLNQTVHPAVFEHFQSWIIAQSTPFIVKEAAILFESGSYKDCDFVISVLANEEIRIQRVMARDKVDRAQVLSRIQNQWTDEQRAEKSDFIIRNENGLDELKAEFQHLLQNINLSISLREG